MKDKKRYDQKAMESLEPKWAAEIEYMLQHKFFFSSRWAARKWGNRLFKEQIKGSDRVCECGCFLGIPSIFLSLTNPKVKIHSFDISPLSMLKSRQLCEKFSSGVNLFTADFKALPFESNSFDWMFGFGVLHHCHYPETIGEIERTLSTGGKALFIEPQSLNPLIRMYRRIRREPYSSTERPYDHAMLGELQRWAPGLEISWTFEHFFSTFMVLIFTLFKKKRRNRRWISLYSKIQGIFGRLDDMLLTHFSGLRSFSQQVIILMQKKG